MNAGLNCCVRLLILCLLLLFNFNQEQAAWPHSEHGFFFNSNVLKMYSIYPLVSLYLKVFLSFTLLKKLLNVHTNILYNIPAPSFKNRQRYRNLASNLQNLTNSQSGNDIKGVCSRYEEAMKTADV